jgi:serine/threonine protein kinase
LVPHGSKELLEILKLFLAYNPEERISARHALKHPYFAQIKAEYEENRPMPIAPHVNVADAAANTTHTGISAKNAADSRLPPIVKKTTARQPPSLAHLYGKKLHAPPQLGIFSNSHSSSLAPHVVSHILRR